MSSATSQTNSEVRAKAQAAQTAARILATLDTARRNAILLSAADLIEQRREAISAANIQDCAAAESELRAGTLPQAMFDRLRTSDKGIADMARKVREVAALPDPLNRILAATELDNDLLLHRVSCPLGVIGVIFESRPDVVPQVGALCLKSGNAALLKGGREAAHTNAVLAEVWRDALTQNDVPHAALQLLQTRADVAEMLQLQGLIDLIIPRGSKEFVEHITRTSAIPVMGHGEGICHVYVDAAADDAKAWRIALDAKVNYPAACNAAETLLVHQDKLKTWWPQMAAQFAASGVEIRGCERIRNVTPEVVAATEADWVTEYGALIIAGRVVNSVDEALDHIARYGSRHTETIVTENHETAEKFMATVDAAGVYHNASTRFADGFRYGFGAEVGISNAKLHARGPVGLEGLTTYKYKLYGDGQTVTDYATGARTFTHRRL